MMNSYCNYHVKICCLDSGCSSHMCFEKDKFVNSKEGIQGFLKLANEDWATDLK